MLSLAACGGEAAPAPRAPSTPIEGDGLSALNQSISIDQVIERQTSAGPAGPAGPRVLSPDEARSAVPFAFGVPAWVPAGFALQDQAEVITSTSRGGYASVHLNWLNAQGAAIELAISQGDTGTLLQGGAGSHEPVEVNGAPATLHHQTRLGADRLTLNWTRDSLAYRLTADAGAATRDDLLHMAQSIP
jgi:hypothetical protein